MRVEWKFVLAALIALAAWSIVGPIVGKITDKFTPDSGESTTNLENY
jgi:hypothetical protein